MPMLRQKLGSALKGIAVDEGLAGREPGSPPTYVAMGHLLFDNLETFQQSFGPNAEAIAADVPNYTNTQPTLQISAVRL